MKAECLMLHRLFRFLFVLRIDIVFRIDKRFLSDIISVYCSGGHSAVRLLLFCLFLLISTLLEIICIPP